MRILMTMAMAGAVALSSSGCASAKEELFRAGGAKVRAGMTEKQVVAMLGRPNGRAALGGKVMLIWIVQAKSLWRGPRPKTFAVVFDQRGRMVGPLETRDVRL